MASKYTNKLSGNIVCTYNENVKKELKYFGKQRVDMNETMQCDTTTTTLVVAATAAVFEREKTVKSINRLYKIL